MHQLDYASCENTHCTVRNNTSNIHLSVYNCMYYGTHWHVVLYCRSFNSKKVAKQLLLQPSLSSICNSGTLLALLISSCSTIAIKVINIVLIKQKTFSIFSIAKQSPLKVQETKWRSFNIPHMCKHIFAPIYQLGRTTSYYWFSQHTKATGDMTNNFIQHLPQYDRKTNTEIMNEEHYWTQPDQNLQQDARQQTQHQTTQLI